MSYRLLEIAQNVTKSCRGTVTQSPEFLQGCSIISERILSDTSSQKWPKHAAGRATLMFGSISLLFVHAQRGAAAQTGPPRSAWSHTRKTSAGCVVQLDERARIDPTFAIVLGKLEECEPASGARRVMLHDGASAPTPERPCTRTRTRLSANDAREQCRIYMPRLGRAGSTQKTRVQEMDLCSVGSAIS